MIVSFGDRSTEALFHDEPARSFRSIPQTIHRRARWKLFLLNSAALLGDLSVPPGNRLEALSGELKGYSIRINDQWRIVFRWTPFGPQEVRIVDYH